MIENASNPQNPQPSLADTINLRLTTITKDIRRYAEEIKQKGATPSQFRLDRYAELNRGKGRIIAEALVFQSQSSEPPFFTTRVEEGEDPSVVFTIPDKNHPRGHLRTKTKVSNIRFPGMIETSDDALSYLQGGMSICSRESVSLAAAEGILSEELSLKADSLPLEAKEIPVVKVSSQQLLAIGKALEFYDQYKETADHNQSNPEIQDKWRQYRSLKNDYVVGTVLPARRGKLPDGFEVIVDLQKDATRKSKRDRIRIVIRNNKHAFQTLLYTGDMGGKMRDEMMWLIGEFDHEYEVDFDTQKKKSQKK